MITTKQRAELKGMASLIQPAFQIGKGGVNDAQVAQIDDYLRVHELVKIPQEKPQRRLLKRYLLKSFR